MIAGSRQRKRIAKNPSGNRKGSHVTEATGSLFSCPHSEIKATGRKDFRYCSTAHRARDANLAEPSENACLIVKEA